LAIFSYVLIGYGFILLANSRQVLYKARRDHSLAMTGPYARTRHPQYAGFILIILGLLFQWPTILTLLMFPVLVWMYTRLAKSEETDAKKEFGQKWAAYASRTPAFIPNFKSKLANEQ
jgi:protein-S-isoprenylcysteine O-methyltransferase Ste14